MLIEFRGHAGAALIGEATGEPDAPAVLMLGGEGADDLWSGAAGALAEAGRYVITLRPRSAGERDPTAHADDVRAVLEAMRSRPVVVGAAPGGIAAVGALGDGGEHLATGLVLVDAASSISVGAPAAAGAAMLASAARIRTPTLVMCGPNDVSAVRAIAEAIPGALRVDMADAEQVAAADRTDAFSALLLDFLESVAPRAAPEYRAGSDPRTLRDALGCFGTGVTVVTTLGAQGEPVGLTANSFTSVSLDPPLLLVCLARTANSLPAFAAADVFAVNVLHTGQQAVSARFSSKTEDRFAATPWEAWDTGAPIIRRSLASFDCAKFDWREAGDHVILVGRVQRVRFEPRRDPLLYFRGRYRRLHFN